MNVSDWLLDGFAATIVLTTLYGVSQGMRLTRMSFPLLIGTMFTDNRERARVYGALVHFGNGILFSYLYVVLFEQLGMSNWWVGTLFGTIHALFLLTVVLPILPSIHPRLASEYHGPTATRYFEPPGFMGLNYGIQTPVATLVSHAAFGAVLGTFYHLKG